MNSRSSGSFVDTDVCKKLGIKYTGKANEVTMVPTTQAVRFHVEFKVNLKIANETYEWITLGVMDNLCADIILGLDFMKMHDGVQFNLPGCKNLLQIDFGKAICSTDVFPATEYANAMAANLLQQNLATIPKKMKHSSRKKLKSYW